MAGLLVASAGASAPLIRSRNAPSGAGGDLFPIDSDSGLLGFYAAYEASGLTALDPYSMKLSVPGAAGQFVQLDDHELTSAGGNECYDLDFTLGTTRTAFFFLKYTGPTARRGTVATGQGITVELYNSRDCTAGVVTSLTDSDGLVQETLSANANKIAIVTVPRNIPEVGQHMFVYVDGGTGNVGEAFGNLFAMQPATAAGAGFGSWRPDVLKLVRTSVCAPDAGETGAVGCGTPTASDQLFLQLPEVHGADYHQVYEFVVIAPPDPNAVIPLTPANYVASGTRNLKHSGPPEDPPRP